MGDRKLGAETERVSPEQAGRVTASSPPRARSSLLLYQREGAKLIPLTLGRPVVVGRGEDADVAVDDINLSRRHARFTLLASGEVKVDDLGSTNGTWMNGQRIDSAQLIPDLEVTLGAIIASLHVLDLAGEAAMELERHARFVRVLSDEIVRAGFFRRSAAVVMVRPLVNDGRPLRRWSPSVQEKLRAVDTMAVYSDDTLEILLPESNIEQVLAFARTLAFSTTPRLACGIASFPESATSAEELMDVARSALRQAKKEAPVSLADRGLARQVAPQGSTKEGPIATSPEMGEVFRTATRVARSVIPVLLLAETGAGKEVVARYLHDKSPRHDRPLVSVNCAALPEQLLESTLFGHEKGAFTGATAQQRGVFESATGGTVFLDEIGELPLAAQAALLRALETKLITRVGSSKEVAVDVRVIAATHRNLETMVREKSFRQDLFYRLNAITLTIPPLRDRRADIPPLAQRFLVEANKANRMRIERIEEDAMALLMAHSWPGNARELRNAIERAVVIAEGDTITVDDLPLGLTGEPAAAPTSAPEGRSKAGDGDVGSEEAAAESGQDFRTRVDRYEIKILLEALKACDWNQTRAARQLQMPLRTLVHKIKVHNLRRLGFAKADA